MTNVIEKKNVTAAEHFHIDLIGLPVEINLCAYLVAGRSHLAKTCFVCPEGEISYACFDKEVRRAASAMSLFGLQARERIAISLDDSIELAVLFFAVMAIGAVPLVLNPNLDAGTLGQIMRDATPALLFGKIHNDAIMRRAISTLATPPRLVFLDTGMLPTERFNWMPVGANPAWNDFVMSEPDAPVLIQYTSGTTGNSKGVVHSARSILSSCAGFARKQLRLTTDDVLYSVPKTFFGYGMGNSLFFPLFLGATAVLDSRWPTCDTVSSNLKVFRPTVLFAVPTMYRMLCEADLAPEDCSVRLAFSAGAPLSEQIGSAWRAKFGSALHDGIGATELCHVFATTYPNALRTGSVGRMVDDWRYRIIDDAGEPVSPGEVGMLLVDAPSVARGYWNKSGESETRFKDGWYRTGDLFSQDEDGFLYFHGRVDDRFKVFGRWVVPLEVENLLADQCPECGDAYLVAGRDASGEDRPVLFLRDARLDFATRAQTASMVISDNLDSYKMPVLFLPLSDVPLTPNGKINRRALSAQAGQALAQPAYGLQEQEV